MENFWLRKGKIYRLRTTTSHFKRNYMLFSPYSDFYFSGTWNCSCNTLFTVNLEGKFNSPSSIGIWIKDELEELTVADWLEVGQLLKNTSLRFNLKTKELIYTTKKEEELVEL